jgi:VWFA-related protein
VEHILIDFLLRSALIAAGTAAVLLIMRVKMAAARHRAWAGVAVLMMLLPAWTAWGPIARLRVLPAPVTAPAARQWTGPAPTFSQITLPSFTAASARPPAWNWPAVFAGIYLVGVCALLARLAIGTMRAHMLVRRATNRGERLTSAACAAPVTVGWLRPTVILPDCWQAWPQAQLDAVLTHEGEHARRRDPLVQWLALLNRAVFWFHPLAWWLESKLSALAEEACDEAVLARGHDPFEYSGYLLEMARSVLQTGVRVKVLGMAMPGSFLPQRIRRILEGRPAPRISRVRMASLGVACATVSAVFATGVVDRRMPAPQPNMSLVMVQGAPEAPPVNLQFDMQPKRHARTVMIAQEPSPQVSTPTEPQEKYKDRRLVVLYFDLRAMPASDRSLAFAAAQDFVRTKMQANDVVAIMTENEGVKVCQDFTDDHNLLLNTVDQLRADPAPDVGAVVDVDRQLISLHTAVQMLASLNGKKNLIYFAEPVGQRTDSAEFRPLIDAAIRANVAFYTVDAWGLMQGPPPEPKQQQLDEVLQKLQELAKRQQELTDQQRNAQQAPSEQRRKQGMLRFEAVRLQQEAIQLNRPPAADKAYVIGPEDVLHIRVAQLEAVTGTYTVRPDGMMSLPWIRNVRAAGLTTAQLEAVIADRFLANQILADPTVTVDVITVHKRQ